jgi:MFS family permease
MLTLKRVLIATLCGFIFGIVCMLLASSNPNSTEPITLTIRWMIIISRTMLGFVIGISALRLVWWQHGLLIGLIASIPMALPVMNNIGIMIGTIVLGMIYGFLTELITSILFKARPVGMLKAI